MSQNSRRKDVPLDNILLHQISERPGIRQNAIVESNLGQYSDSYVRYRLVFLEKTGRIERRRTGARCVECYLTEAIDSDSDAREERMVRAYAERTGDRTPLNLFHREVGRK